MTNLFDESNEVTILEMPNARVRYYPNFIKKVEQQELYRQLHEEIEWQQDDIKVFGKVHPQPRLTALYASHEKPYSYSSITMFPKIFTPLLENIKSRVEKITTNTFNTCLLNLYRDGKDSNGWHADDEKELGINPVIASISLGADRNFKFRRKDNKKDTRKLLLESGSLLLMENETQHYWQHQVPKTSKAISPRINLTFRKIALD